MVLPAFREACSLGVFVADVRPRWSDMDSYGHVNHASTVTLLEEARVELIFTEAARHGVNGLNRGLVVTKLAVDYHRPLVVDGGSIRVEMAVRELRSASFSIDYKVRVGRAPMDAVAATASTRLVPYNRSSERPRRLTDAERDFLAGWLARSDGIGG